MTKKKDTSVKELSASLRRPGKPVSIKEMHAAVANGALRTMQRH